MKKSTVLLVAFSICASCATVSYIEPEGEKTRARFAVIDGAKEQFFDSANLIIRAYKNDECEGEREWMRLLNGYLVNSDHRRLDMPLWDYHKNGAKEFYVTTEESLHLMFESSMGSYNGASQSTHSCGVYVETKLNTEVDYEFVYQQSARDRCSVELNELVETDQGYERNKLETFTNDAYIASEGCVKAFQKMRWY